MTYRNVRNPVPQDFEGSFEEYTKLMMGDGLTAIPKGWTPVQAYNNRGRPEDDCVIREAGWCPKCKETLEECICNEGTDDIFDTED